MARFQGALVLIAALSLAACQSPGNAGLATASIGPMSASTPGTDSFEASTPIVFNGVSEAPSGYTAFCAREPDQCRDDDGKPSVITLNAESWRTLKLVNAAWNVSVKPMEDAAHYGRVDYWTIPKDGYGDCEDYALGKRKSLVDIGMPRRALRLALAQTPTGEAHTVLVAATDHGDYVLDNLNPSILPWESVGYQWIALQMPGHAQWASVAPVGPDFTPAMIAGLQRR